MKIFKKGKGVTINLSTEGIIRAIVLTILAVFVISFIGNVSQQLTLIAIAAFLALALNPAVSWISRRLHIKSRIWATGLAYIIVLALLTTFIIVVVPPFVNQTRTFIQNIPNTLEQLKDDSTAPGRIVERYDLQDDIDRAINEVKDRASDAPSYVLSTATRVGGVFVSLITVIVLTFMMLVEGPLWMKRFAALLPEEKRKPYKELASKMYGVVTGYVNGQVLIAAIAAVFAMLALFIAGRATGTSPNILAMGGIVFICGLIPLIGNIIAAVVVVLLSLFLSTPLAIIMLIYFPVYQQIENATLQPHIQAKNNQLTPLLVFVAALLGAGFGGLLGALVAIPVAGCLRVLFEYHFGDRMVVTDDKVKNAKE